MNKERYYHKLETIKESGNYRILREIEHNGFLIHDDGREMLNLSSNDYLGLSSNPRLIEEFREETDVMALPYSAVSSRLLSGNHPYYKMLEDDLADLYDKEAALVFNSSEITGLLCSVCHARLTVRYGVSVSRYTESHCRARISSRRSPAYKPIMTKT